MGLTFLYGQSRNTGVMDSGTERIWSRLQPRGGTQVPVEVRTHLEAVEGDILVWTLGEEKDVRVRRGEVREVTTEWPRK